ncbi:MAG: nitrogen fixation protein NifH, partial [Spirochaetia bacterium]
MADWESYLKADPTDWLLEADNPSVRYFTLTEILGKPPEAKEVIAAKEQITKSGPVPVILAAREN